ncbi:RNA polymerase sigma-70 factor [Marinilongibacter aquaticus]|uniref:RNA polymerase sigma-70 factor n=1 Tax=Marinilongibacter aquaticus TaxID=2975157 RepID=UPI0021BD6F7C|nr:RNA polymerase sigma-70 factor [Marinilongibacter aquaticus]UBM60290.1 RNA polymerase sigma-70 factor [Marinilongibacter aquaticus]
MTEEEQLQAIRKGVKAVYETIFRTHYTSLCRYALSMVKMSDKAEDIVQQVFVNLWEKREQTIITGSLRNYLFRSVHNQCLNALKHDKVKAQYHEYSSFFDTKYTNAVEEGLLSHELAWKIEEALNQLPPECGRVFKMSRFEELKYKEIAEKLGISIKTVENHMGKALKILRGHLGEYLVSILLLIFRS